MKDRKSCICVWVQMSGLGRRVPALTLIFDNSCADSSPLVGMSWSWWQNCRAPSPTRCQCQPRNQQHSELRKQSWIAAASLKTSSSSSSIHGRAEGCVRGCQGSGAALGIWETGNGSVWSSWKLRKGGGKNSPIYSHRKGWGRVLSQL